MTSLAISSCMAPNMDSFCRHLSAYLAEKLSIPVTLVMDLPWQERERLLDQGEIDLCWICGLPYVLKADRSPGLVEPLVAPVMAGSRYQNRPIYFSDVIVHRDSSFKTISDLHGATWAYNEPGSHSGFGVVRYTLALQGKSFAYFSTVIESGAHQNSLRMILDREVDASAIDSTVLELEMRRDPQITSQIRVIDTFGPSPIPPWVISGNTPVELRQRLLERFVHMALDPEGQRILHEVGITRFTPTLDRDYDTIREMGLP